jgi:hypothetical protein
MVLKNYLLLWCIYDSRKRERWVGTYHRLSVVVDDDHASLHEVLQEKPVQ